MKALELRKLIREEVRRMVKEEKKSPVSLQGKHTKYNEIVSQIEKGLAKMESMITTYDIYTI